MAPRDPHHPLAATRVKRLEMKHPLAIRWFHWINFPVLAVMIWSGLLIYWANDEDYYRIGFGHTTLFKFFPDWFFNNKHYPIAFRLDTGRAWHFFFMWFFAINGLLYVLYTLFSGEWRHLVPNRNTLKEAWQVLLYDLHLSKVHPPRQKFNGAQRIAYTLIIIMGFFSLLSGLAIYKSASFGWATWLLGGYKMARWEHFWLTIGYCVFFLVHIAQVIKAGWNNFRAMITGYEIVPVEEN